MRNIIRDVYRECSSASHRLFVRATVSTVLFGSGDATACGATVLFGSGGATACGATACSATACSATVLFGCSVYRDSR